MADAIVVGGGPAGASAAALLARRGLDVLLFERAAFPRDHVGESLLPATLPLLEELGALDAVRAEGFVKKWGATMVWGRDREPWSWYFHETNATHPHTYQVWRPRFDQILLENARDRGADVRERHRVREVLFEGERAVGVRYCDEREREHTARARFVLDASGQSTLLARARRLRRMDPWFENLAVYAYFSGAARLPAPDQGNILVESFDGGWVWVIPLHTGWTSVGAVLDRARARAEIRESGPEKLLDSALAQAAHARALLAGAPRERAPVVVSDWSYRARRCAGPGWLLLGDAACFVDPLFSSGVHLALGAGVLAAALVAGVQDDPSLEDAAGRAYERLYGEQYDHFWALARLFYASNRSVESYFWEARRLLGWDEALGPREAFVRAVAGRPPRGYERAVLERGELPEAFVGRVRGIESERRARTDELDRIGRERLAAAAPRLARGVRVERRAVLAGDRFVWGDAIVAEGRADEVPCSRLVGALVGALDGRTRLGALAEALGAPALDAARILYVDGLVESLALEGR